MDWNEIHPELRILYNNMLISHTSASKGKSDAAETNAQELMGSLTKKLNAVSICVFCYYGEKDPICRGCIVIGGRHVNFIEKKGE